MPNYVLHSIYSSMCLATVIVAASGAFAQTTEGATQPSPTAPSNPPPSVVIVHGAFADGSDWAKVVPLLQAKGLHVVAVQNPLSSLADDAAATKRVVDAQSGKVVLVGHSWGGTVITQAGEHPKVSALVYVAAFAPDVGQATGELGKGFASAPGLAHLTHDATGWLALSPEGMRKHFAQDLPAEVTTVMAATQGWIAGDTFGQKVSAAAWRSRPSWYLLTEDDHMLLPEQQRAMAQTIKARLSTVKSSHVPQQSQPAKVAEVILNAVEAVR